MKKIFKKIKLRDLIFFIIGGLIIGGIGITATTYILQANEIEYKNNKLVQEAIEELYTMAQNSGGSTETLPIGTLDIAGQTIYIPYIGTYKSVYCVYGTTESYGSVGTINNGKCNLSGLTVNTKYYYKIIGYDNAGNLYETKGEATTASRKPTISLNNLPTGVKAIVYLDPTDLSRYCDASNSTEGSGTRGCMKWYAFKEDSTSYTMILDHNTTSAVSDWSAANTQLTTDTTGWSGSPRLITIQEVGELTGCPVNISGYSFRGSNTPSDYYWLYDYSSGCPSYGCKVADNSVDGYWTSTPASSNNKKDGYYVRCTGSFSSSSYWAVEEVSNKGFGVRPVITVSKSNF